MTDQFSNTEPTEQESDVHTDGDTSEPQEREGLFRKEVLEHKKNSFWGKVTLINKISYLAWSIGLASIAFGLILFVVFASYAKHRQARGVLLPSQGLLQIYAQSPGVVQECFVKFGDKVVKGQNLYYISTEAYVGGSDGSFNERQIEMLERQITLQKNRLKMQQDSVERYRKLLDQHYVSMLEYQHYYDAYLQGQIALQDLEQNLAKAKVSRGHTVQAPADGVISNLIAKVGDRVTVERPLASLVPYGDKLSAVLYVHNKDIGFVEVGQKILLRYDAFPYQNYGMYEATVVQIDDSPLMPQEINLNIGPDPAAPYEPFFRVVAELAKQTVKVQGKEQALHAGVTFIGDIVGDRRKIWQWILEPIWVIRGGIVSRGIH